MFFPFKCKFMLCFLLAALCYIQKNKIYTNIYQNGDLNSSCCTGDSCILTICSGYKELVKLFCLKVQRILGEYTTNWIHSECKSIWSLCVGIYDNVLDVWYCISICSLKLEHCIHRKSTDKINMNLLLINNSSSITEIQIINSTAFIVMYMHMYEIIHHYNIISYSIQVFITVYTLVYKEAWRTTTCRILWLTTLFSGTDTA